MADRLRRSLRAVTAEGAKRLGAGGCPLRLAWRPFNVELPRPLRTAAGSLDHKRGWLLRLEAPGPVVGWGEAAPLAGGTLDIARAIEGLGAELVRDRLESALPALPPALAFALGAALAEIDGEIGGENGCETGDRRDGWLPPPPSAWLLPAGADALATLELLRPDPARSSGPAGRSPVFKWKVATVSDAEERTVLETLLSRLPAGSRLRLDANGGWDRATASLWARRLREEPGLEWLEQPLDPADQEGLEALARQLPVALDESLQQRPELRWLWPGWQVRRPSQEGDPRPLLRQLRVGTPRLMVSTAFETGIGRRWLHHLAALQAAGPTPAAPGLAPGWLPEGRLFAADPRQVWQAAA